MKKTNKQNYSPTRPSRKGGVIYIIIVKDLLTSVYFRFVATIIIKIF